MKIRSENINTKDYWNKRYFSIKNNVPAVASLENFFKFDFLPKDEEFSVLDIGCGTATHYPYIHEKYPKVKIVGADISNFATLFNKKNYKFADFLEINIENQDLPQTYDYIISSHTFEHLTDPVAATNKCIVAARKSVVICVPYKDSWSYDPEHLHKFDENDPYKLGSYVKNFVEWDEENKVGAIYFEFKGKA